MNYLINKDSKNIMNLIIGLIGIMGILDLYFTLQWIVNNPYMEANPFMRSLWFISPILFVLFKLSITVVFCLVAFKLKNNKLMKLLIWLPFCTYFFVMYLHFYVM